MRNANFQNTNSELKFDVIYDLRVIKHDYLSCSGFLTVGIATFNTISRPKELGNRYHFCH
jgi:hypothetical protein